MSVNFDEIKTSIKTTALNNSDTIRYFSDISKISQYFYEDSNNSIENAMALINKLETRRNLETFVSLDSNLYLIKLSYLLEKRKFSQIIKILKSSHVSKNEDWRNSFTIQWIKSITLLNLGEFDESISSFRELIKNMSNETKLTIAWKLNKAQVQAYYGLALSVRYFFDKKYRETGIEEIDQALFDTIKLKDQQLLGEILYLLGSYHSSQKQWVQAIATLDIAENYSINAGDIENLININNQKAIASRVNGQLNKSLFYFRRSIELSNESNNEALVPDFYLGLALIYEVLGNYSQAQRMILKSMKFYTDNSFFSIIAHSEKVLGRIYRNSGRIHLALELHIKSREFYKLKQENIFIELTVELSLDYLKYKNYRKSEFLALLVLLYTNKDTLNELEMQKIKISSGISFWKIVDVLNLLQNEDIEFILKKDSIDLDSEYQIKALLVLALVQGSVKNSTKLEWLLSQIKIGIDLLSINHQLSYYQLKMDYLSLKNEFNDLNSVALNVLELIESTRKQFDVSDLALHWTHQAKSILDKYINVLVEQKKYIEIFNLLEKYYAINLREKRHNTTSEIIQQKSKKIQQALDNYIKLERETLLSKDDDVQNKADEAKEHFLALNENEQTTQKRELTYLTIEELQKKLSDRELFLRYYLNEKYAFVFVIDSSSFEVIQLPDKSKLRYMVKAILNNIKSKRFNELSEQNNLFNKILPQEKIISGLYEKVIIIPDGVLNLLPFASININPKAGSYTPLVSKINIERTYSASDYFAGIELPINKNTISIFSNPIFLQASHKEELLKSIPKTNKLWEFSPLPYTDQEAEAIQISFPDYEINKMSGVFATNENLLSERTRNSNIIHIATHGFFNDENLENVGIATTIIDENNERAPGVLAMREILYQPFKANLAVVSGCETTLGKEINGEGFNSLSRGLLSQGVSSVIGTIWSISDRATPVFMKEFYTNLRDMNGNVSKALNATKSNFATQARFRRYRHPYYWAGFVLTSSNRGISENIFNN